MRCMNITNNLSIRFKLLGGFFAILAVFIGFGVYLLVTFTRVETSFNELTGQAKKLKLFLSLDTETNQLSDSLKSFMLTKDTKWQTVYDTTSANLDNLLLSIQSVQDAGTETTNVANITSILDRIRGTELLILEKTKEGNSEQAVALFDNNYENQKESVANLVGNLVSHETSDFNQTLVDNTTLLNQAKNILLIVIIFILFLTILIAFAFASLISRSLNKLVISAQKIAGGDFATRAVVSSRDEIGELAEVFNDMASKLQESYASIEQQVQQKTQELSEKVGDLEMTKKAMINVLEDVQEEKIKAEGEKARDDALLASIGDGLIATDIHGNILMVNSSAESMLGWTRDELIAQSLYNLIPMLDDSGSLVSREKRPANLSLTSGQKITTTTNSEDTYYYVRKDKTKFPVIITVTPVKSNAMIIGSIVIFRDATKEKHVDRMKTEFISLASHQLRTPLSAIRWFTEMLLNGDAGKLSPEQEEFAKNINDSTQRMIDLVNSLLNISRIESGRILVDPKPTDLKELVDSLVVELKAKITERQQNLIVSVHGDLPKIMVDPKLIRQVYMNLLTNAIKYTPKGGEISVFISRKNDDVLSQVSDNGYGIPKAQHDKVFQKFFRAENIVKVETDGTGLGLYLIKAIIESSKGRIWFESEEGKGTTFFFTLPLSGMAAKAGEVTLD